MAVNIFKDELQHAQMFGKIGRASCRERVLDDV